MKLIIDGYNLIASTNILKERKDALSKNCKYLIDLLVQYNSFKKFHIIVIFDGWQYGYPIETSEDIKGIKVIYSKRGEKADEVIKKMASKLKDSCLVVSSDREIVDYVEKAGSNSISAKEFASRLSLSVAYQKGAIEDDEDEDWNDYGRHYTKKKGNSRRLPKKKRQASIKIKKI